MLSDKQLSELARCTAEDMIRAYNAGYGLEQIINAAKQTAASGLSHDEYHVFLTHLESEEIASKFNYNPWPR